MNNDTQNFSGEARTRPNVLEMTEFTIPVAQAAEILKAAGFPLSQDHISRLCRQGKLHATRQDTKNKLVRYVISRASLDVFIEERRAEQREREQPQVFSADMMTAAPRHNDDTDEVAVRSSRSHDDIDHADVSPSFMPMTNDAPPRLIELLQRTQQENQRLAGKLEAKEDENVRLERKAAEAESKAIGLAVQLGTWKHRAAEAEGKLLELAAPKPAQPEPTAAEPTTTANDDSKRPSLWRRLFGSR